jgi:hypothetical protein
MEGARSFHQVFAHVAAEGNLESAMFGAKLPAGSMANFDAEETRLGKLPDDQLIAAMDQSLRLLSATVAGLSLDKMNTSITYYGQPALPRVAATYTLNDLHEHLGQLVSYARMQQIMPPWSRKSGERTRSQVVVGAGLGSGRRLDLHLCPLSPFGATRQL